MATAAAGRVTQRIGTKLGTSSKAIKGPGCCPSSGTACGTPACPIEVTTHKMAKAPTNAEIEAIRASVRARMTPQQQTNTTSIAKTQTQSGTNTSINAKTFQFQNGALSILTEHTQPSLIPHSLTKNIQKKIDTNTSITPYINAPKPSLEKTQNTPKVLLTSKKTPTLLTSYPKLFQIPSLFSLYHHVFTNHHQHATVIQKHVRANLAKIIYLKTALDQGINGLAKLKGNEKITHKLKSSPTLLGFLSLFPIQLEKNKLAQLLDIYPITQLHTLSLTDIRNKAMIIKLKKAIEENNLIKLSTLNGKENILYDLTQNEKLELSRLLKLNITDFTTLTCNEINKFATNQLNSFKETMQQLYNQISELKPLNETVLFILKETLSSQNSYPLYSSPFDPLLIKNETELYEKLISILDKLTNLFDSFLQKPNFNIITDFSVANILFHQSLTLINKTQKAAIISILETTLEKHEILILTKNNIENEINLYLGKLSHLDQFLDTNSDDGKTDSENSLSYSEEKQDLILKKFYSSLEALKAKNVSASKVEELVEHQQTLLNLTSEINKYIKQQKKLAIFLNSKKELLNHLITTTHSDTKNIKILQNSNLVDEIKKSFVTILTKAKLANDSSLINKLNELLNKTKIKLNQL